MLKRTIRNIKDKLIKTYSSIFAAVYQFDSPVCFLNEEDYDLSGKWKKIEPQIEEEFEDDLDTPHDQYDVLTRNLMELVLGKYMEKLANVERTETLHEADILRNFPGWNNDVFFVLHYEYFNITWHRKQRLLDFDLLKSILHTFGIYPDPTRLEDAYNKYKRKIDGLIDFINFLQILYWCDNLEEDGSLGSTAEALRIQGLNYKMGSSLDLANLLEYGLL